MRRKNAQYVFVYLTSSIYAIRTDKLLDHLAVILTILEIIINFETQLVALYPEM